MPNIRPFRGLRYDPERAGDIPDLVAPPYDIIFDEWREQLYARNPHNIIRLIKTKEEPGDTETSNKYTRAAGYIGTWMDAGILKRENRPSMYVRADTYAVNGETKTRYGFVALMRVEEFGATVHPHEMTLSGPKIDRLELVKATGANLSQIFSIFRDSEDEIQNLLLNAAKAAPDIDFIDEQGIRRRLWIVSDPGFASKLGALMKQRDIIIADGHHRYETAIAYKSLMETRRTSDDEPFNYVTMYFSSGDAPGMTILPTHRKISGFEGFDEDTFFSRLSSAYDLELMEAENVQAVLARIAQYSTGTNAFGIYTRQGYRIARNREPASPKDIDVEVLHNEIIEDLLGIRKADIAAGRYVHFSKSPDHAIEDIDSGKDQIAFLLNAITTDELFRKVLDGNRMPQKSTYFFPKTMSGLVMYKIDRESLG